MILGIVIILLKAYLDSKSFLINVNGVLQKDWNWIIILLGIVIAVFGLISLLVYVLHIRLKQANTIFSEPDENKRLAMHSKFDVQAKKASKIQVACALYLAKIMLYGFKGNFLFETVTKMSF